jgi:hypothetical protein
LLTGVANAQTFPNANQYTALPCGGGPMTDPTGDTPGATGGLDLVGTNPSPAGFHAADANFLYLRLRLAGTPISGARLLPNGWGYELDLDGNPTTYELMISVSGTGATDQVAIFRHPTTTTPDDPAEQAVLPAAFTYPATTHSQVVVANTALGGGTDMFLDLAVPWTDLATVGVQRDTRIRVWAGSSTLANALNLDLACFSGAGGHFSMIDVDVIAPDPAVVIGGPDGGTGGTGPRTLEGGLGCGLGGAASPTAVVLILLVAGALLLRRQKS